MTEQQIRSLIAELWLEVERCGRESDRWKLTAHEIARQYRGERRAYRDVIYRLDSILSPPDAPGRAERETQPPGNPASYAERG